MNHRYSYNGPVYEFDTRVADRWKAETIAANEAKARNNLAYQYKRTHNKARDAKITCPGELKIVG